MLIIETVHIYYGHTCPTKQLEIEKHGKLPVLIKNSYLAFVSFCFGAVIEHLTTDIGKYGVGRLRPHFFSVCHLNMSMIDCKKGYIEDYECTGDADQIREVRLVGILRPSPSASVAQSDACPAGDWEVVGSTPDGSSNRNIFYGHSSPSADSWRAVVSFWRKNVHKWSTA